MKNSKAIIVKFKYFYPANANKIILCEISTILDQRERIPLYKVKS